jgi:ankyrin repeat protein
LLLNKQADGAHVSAWNGWNVLVYLLEGAHRFDATQTHGLQEFLNLLNHDEVHIDTEARDDTGQDALQLASAWYSGEVVEQLFNLGASMASYGRQPWRYPGNPLWNAISSNNVSAFRLLLSKYPDLNALDRRGFRMINYTARSGYSNLTEILLERGAEEIIPACELKVDEELAPGELDDWTDPIPDGDDMEQDTDPASDDYTENEYCDSECNLNDLEGVDSWTREKYLKYRDALIRYGRVIMRERDAEEGGGEDVFWNALCDPWDAYSPYR